VWVGGIRAHSGKEGRKEGGVTVSRFCDGIGRVPAFFFRERKYKIVSLVSFSGFCAMRGERRAGVLIAGVWWGLLVPDCGSVCFNFFSAVLYVLE